MRTGVERAAGDVVFTWLPRPDDSRKRDCRKKTPIVFVPPPHFDVNGHTPRLHLAVRDKTAIPAGHKCLTTRFGSQMRRARSRRCGCAYRGDRAVTIMLLMPSRSPAMPRGIAEPRLSSIENPTGIMD